MLKPFMPAAKPGFRKFSFRNFASNDRGNVAMVFSLAFIPIMASVGVAVDMGRAVLLASSVQSAVDNAALAVAAGTGDAATRKASADAILIASLRQEAATTLTVTNAGEVNYQATIDMPTMFAPFVTPSIRVSRSASARAGVAGTPGTPGTNERVDDSCIYSLGEDLQVNVDTLTFNGSPNVNLTGCSLRSNKSMKCNGSDTGAHSYAVGSIVGCANPHPNQPVFPDLYAAAATNITRVCDSGAGGRTWSVNGVLPAESATVKYVSRSGYREIHICGTLTLSGVGSISGNNPTEDTVIVVENGGVLFLNDSDITAKRTSIVLAGSYSYSSGVTPRLIFPDGAGNHATLRISASTADGNPWKGLALYQNPVLNDNVDMTWKPGSMVYVDGIVYFPRARLTVQGSIAYGPGNCSKLVLGELTLNGAVDLKQTAAGCASMKVVQYYVAPVAATPGTATTSSYLVQ